MTKSQAEAKLREAGATIEKREDRYGDTKTGWWLDGVWLAKANDPVGALNALEGR